MLKKLLELSFLVVILHLSTGLQAATFNVTTPAEFQTALTTAQANGEANTINVAAGDYAIDSTLTYSTEENFDLAVVGAGATTTILDGGNARQCLSLTNNSGGGISVSGLTCRNGRAANLGGGLAINCVNGAISMSNCRIEDNVSDRSAGGAFIGGFNGAITVSSCVVDGNSLDPVTGDDGGGLNLYIDTGGTADITLENSTITNNYIGECPSAVGSPDGAGVFMYHLGSGGTITVRNNTISNNTALGGPAGFYFRAPVDSTLVFDGNTVSGNTSGRSTVGVSGGGVHIQLDVAAVTFSNNKILDNRAIGPWANGGGVDFAVETGGSCEIINNAFAGNTAQQHGGGMSLSMAEGLTRAVVAGNLFVNNKASTEDGSGGGLMLNAECDSTMADNTFYNNSASGAGGLGYYTEGAGRSLTIASDIYRSNTPDSVSNIGIGSFTATYSNVQGGSGESWFGTGCVDSDPLFFNASNPPGADGVYATIDDGLHLTATSPSMNTGSNAAVPETLTTDIAGQARIQNTTVDMGAYEGVADTPATPTVTTTEASSVTSTSAQSGGNVTSNGGASVTTRGVCWSTSANPTTSNSKTIDGTGTGSFTSSITGLSPDTTYHFRAYATNSSGTGYGSDMTFKTSTTDISAVYFPHIASTATWETEICAINTSATQTINGVFKAYTDAGVLVSEIDDVTLAPYGRREITVGDEFADPGDIGYIIFESDSSAVTGYTKFYIEGQYRVAIPAVSDSEINTSDIYISHIASTSIWWTGISLLNTTLSPKTLTIEFDNGEIKTKELAANEHSAFTIKSLCNNQSQLDIQSAVIKQGGGVIGLELFGSGNQLSGILLKDDTTTKIYYPHVASDATWWTGIVAYNPSASASTITITPYNAGGTSLAPQSLPISGQGKYIGTVAGLNLPVGTAWFQIDATSPITGFELFGTQNGNQLAGYTGVGISGKTGVFAKLEKNGWTGIAFVNLGDSTASILLTAYDNSGNAITTKTVGLAGHAKMVDMAPNLFSQDISNATYITYSSDLDVVGFQLNGSADNMMLDGLPGM